MQSAAPTPASRSWLPWWMEFLRWALAGVVAVTMTSRR